MRHTPTKQIWVADVDVSARYIRGSSLTATQSLDIPNFTSFKNSNLRLILDNSDGDLTITRASNLFTRAGYPAFGKNVPVQLALGTSISDLEVVWTGIVNNVTTRLTERQAVLDAVSIGVYLSQLKIDQFGLEITREITLYPGATVEFSTDNPIFYLPEWGIPVIPGSVSGSILNSDGTKTALTVVNTIKHVGSLSATTIEVDHAHGFIRFEAPPSAGAETRIQLTWKVPHQHRRADGLIRELIDTSPIPSRIGISDSRIRNRFIKHQRVQLSAPQFSSRGNPYFTIPGVVRAQVNDPSNNRTYLIREGTLIEYDEVSDSYTELKSIPDDSNLGSGQTGFGQRESDKDILLTNQSISAYYLNSFQVHNNVVYNVKSNGNNFYPSATISSYNLDGSVINLNLLTVNLAGSNEQILSMGVYNNRLYLLVRSGNNRVTVVSYPLPLTSSSQMTTHFSTNYDSLGSTQNSFIAITADRVIIARTIFNTRRLHFFTHTGTRQASEQRDIGSASIDGIFATSSHLFVLGGNTVQGYRLSDFSADTDLSVTVTSSRRLSYWGNTFYTKQDYTRFSNLSNRTIRAYSLGTSVVYEGFVGFYVVSTDFENFYIFATNTANADVLTDTGFSRCRVYRYNKTADTIAELLGPSKGNPQLSMAFDFIDDQKNLGDNRKTFAVINKTNKDYIFYRRVQTGSAGVAYYDVTADTVTDIYKETWSGNAHKGLPYSIDFMLDERSDGIYVYTFVVSYTTSSASLKVYRKRVLPDASQSEIFSESWSSIGNSTYFPTSVTGVMLADDRSKIYFVLDYRRKSTTLVGRAELCSIAKSGSGSRTVIKTYANPLLCARSPANVDGKYYYVEGGWVRLPRDADTDPVDQHYYPNSGGGIIEVLSNDTANELDAWQSATLLSSPDPTDKARYGGWGRHNAFTSNMINDGNGNLLVVSGYGQPVNLTNNRPLIQPLNVVQSRQNFAWLQYGDDHAARISIYPTKIENVSQSIETLAKMINAEWGFGAPVAAVQSLRQQHPSVTQWQGFALPFLRSRRGGGASTLRTAIAVSGAVSSIAVNSDTVFTQTAGQVQIGRELFRYTGITADATGFMLTGVNRAAGGSAMAAHPVNSPVSVVDYHFADSLDIPGLAIDFLNLKNRIEVPYGDTVAVDINTASVTAYGEQQFSVGQTLMIQTDQPWAEWLAAAYASLLNEPPAPVTVTVTLHPVTASGDDHCGVQSVRLRLYFIQSDVPFP